MIRDSLAARVPSNKLARRGLSRLFKAHREFGQAGKKERGAR